MTYTTTTAAKIGEHCHGFLIEDRYDLLDGSIMLIAVCQAGHRFRVGEIPAMAGRIRCYTCSKPRPGSSHLAEYKIWYGRSKCAIDDERPSNDPS